MSKTTTSPPPTQQIDLTIVDPPSVPVPVPATATAAAIAPATTTIAPTRIEMDKTPDCTVPEIFPALELPALNRPAVLGSLYDAKVDKFCHSLLLDENSPGFASARKILSTPNTEIKYILNDNYETKFSTLGLPPEMQLAILSGLVSLEGSSEFLKVGGAGTKNNLPPHSTVITKGYLVFTLTTVNEELNILNAITSNCSGINLEILEHSNATHVVANVKWGFRLIIEIIYAKLENYSKNEEGTEDETQAQIKVKEFVEKIGQLLTSDENDDSVKSKVKKGLKNLADNKYGNKFTIRLHGDVIPPENKMPSSIQEAIEILSGVRQWKKILEKINTGKGIPLRYELVSLSGLEKILKLNNNFKIPKSHDHLLTEDPRVVSRVVGKFDRIELAQKHLDEVYGEVSMFQNFLDPSRHVQFVTNLKTNFCEERSHLENQLKLSLLSVKKNGWGSDVGMDKILKNFNDSPHSDGKLLEVLTTDENVRRMRDKIKILRFLQTKNVLLIPKGEDVQFKIYENMSKKIAVVLWAVKNFLREDDKWEENLQTFLYMLSDKSKEQRFVFVDGEFHEDLKEMKKMSCSRILMFEQSKLIIDDALETLVEGDRMQDQVKKFGENKFVWTIDNFSVKLKLAKEKKKLFLYSEPFYMNKYKFKAQVYLNGHDASTANHMSVYVLILPGFADNLVTWPFTQEIYMTLLPQNSQKSGGHVQIVTSAKFPDLFKRQFDANAARGSGYAKFVTHPILLHGEGNFLKDDKILIEFRL